MGQQREGGNAWAPVGARTGRKRGYRRCLTRTVMAWAVIWTMLGRRWLQIEPRGSLASLDRVPTFSPQLNNWGPWRAWIVPYSSEVKRVQGRKLSHEAFMMQAPAASNGL